MLIKEYRICMPMTVEDYRIAQLYMIQKKSREESTGAESGVEILKNEPYENGPGGSGQYTYKIYHIGSKLPAWFRSILPKSALRVEEEAWNAYPYTKTQYKVPFVEKFTLEVETKYLNDSGETEGVFHLTDQEKQDRILDYIDIVRDVVPSGDYKLEEDPSQYISKRTGRGPLTENWREDWAVSQRAGENYQDYVEPENGETVILPKRIMCAYKLCKVEFKYWGMQGKIERFIHDIALRKTMVRAHRQAWCWQDEYYGLTIDDIRELEAKAAAELAAKMAALQAGLDESEAEAKAKESKRRASKLSSSPQPTPLPSIKGKSQIVEEDSTSVSNWSQLVKLDHSMRHGAASCESLQRLETASLCEDDEFFDAPDSVDAETASYITCRSTSTLKTTDDRDTDRCSTPTNKGQTSVLLLVVHGGSLLDTNDEYHNKSVDLTTLRSTIETVTEAHYPSLKGRVALRLVPCPPVVTEVLQTLASLSPYAFDMQGHLENVLAHDFVPLGTIPLFFTESAQYDQLMESLCSRLNSRYREFLLSAEGQNFSGNVCIIGDCTGSILMYDLLCRLKKSNLHLDTGSKTSLQEEESDSELGETDSDKIDLRISGCKASTSHAPYNRSHSTTDRSSGKSLSLTSIVVPNPLKLEFEVQNFYMLGSPLALVMAFRHSKLDSSNHNKSFGRPECGQVFNLFHLTDPCAFRIEPLLESHFRYVAPMRVPRYYRYPMGDGQAHSLVENVIQHASVFINHQPSWSGDAQHPGPTGDVNQSNSDIMESILTNLPPLRRLWWGSQRIDYTLHSPDALQNFSIKALPHLLHASYWESSDLAAFIVRQLVPELGADTFTSPINRQIDDIARPKWKNRGNSYKLKSVSPNHRANDVIVLDTHPRILSAKFMYGPLDMLSLSGETVDVHIMNQPNTQWELIGSDTTDNNGRVQFKVPDSKHLAPGMYPVKMIVRPDHSEVNLTLGILPPKCEAVVFSIDGSFAASVSIMGKDPKVRPGAVDVVRHWQDLGYILIYITARPDMQQRRVVSWLAHHNFPHGMVFFMDGISKEPMRQKTNVLNKLVADADIKFHCAYGSPKDISVYRSLDLQPNQIFIVGKASKKKAANASFLTDGYAAHLKDLITRNPLSKPAFIAAQLMLRKSCFELPQKSASLLRKRSLASKRVSSMTGCTSGSQEDSGDHYPSSPHLSRKSHVGVSPEGNTIVVDGSGSNSLSRGLPPRLS